MEQLLYNIEDFIITSFSVLLEILEQTYLYDPIIPKSEYWKYPVGMIFIEYIVIVAIFRKFLNGMYLFFLTKRQSQKKMRGLTFKESLTYSRFRDEIPNGWIYFYWFVIGFFPSIMIPAFIIQTVYGADPFVEYVIQLFTHTMAAIAILVLVIFEIAFYGEDGFAYDRWILSPKERKRRLAEKEKKKATRKTMRIQRK